MISRRGLFKAMLGLSIVAVLGKPAASIAYFGNGDFSAIPRGAEVVGVRANNRRVHTVLFANGTSMPVSISLLTKVYTQPVRKT